MFVNTIYRRLIFMILFSFFSFLFILALFSPIYNAESIFIPFTINPHDICKEYPVFWEHFKNLYLLFHFLANIIYSHLIYSLLFRKAKPLPDFSSYHSSNELSLFIGNNSLGQPIYLTESSLYQNILITGTIGTGKTSCAIYPFTRQLIEYQANSFENKLAMLILDVKGNYYKQVQKYSKKFNRDDDTIIIELNGNVKYNPLDKPYLKASVLANRLKTILTLFSKNHSESYWLDKAEQLLTESIKLCRLYNDGYVTFLELHKLITDSNYYTQKIKFIRNLFISGKLSRENVYDLLSAIEFFEKEFSSLDTRTSSILKSEISRITGCFVSDYYVQSTFCSPKDDLTFLGFEDVIENGKIVVLNMNISEYRNLSKIIAAYLKLDFQSAVMTRLANNSSSNFRTVCFISDEYQEYITDTDANFYSQSREAKCINIVATQSYTSLLNSINNQYTVKVIVQNLINKLWFRNDDIFTIEEAQKQIGKEEKQKYSKSISENAKETKYNHLFHRFNSNSSALSESINCYTQLDYVFDTHFFTQELETFSCLSFLSTGSKILPPEKLILIPYFISEK